MADIDAIARALRKADAAGDTEGARRLAQAYRAAQATKSDFADVESSVSPTVRDFNPASRVTRKTAQQQKPKIDQFGEGFAAPVADLILGASQLTGIGSGKWRAETKNRIEAATDTPMGVAGNVAGEIGLLAVPGGAIAKAAKGAKYAKTAIVGGNALLGAAYSGAKGVHDGETRGGNAAIGGLAGLAGGTAGVGLSYGAKAVGGVAAPIFKRGQENIAARAIRAAATNPNALQNTSRSAIPGVQRTLAETSLDPGVAGLQRQFQTQLSPIYDANNAARAQAIRGAFHGADDVAISGIESARNSEASRVLSGLQGAGAPDLAPVHSRLGALIDEQAGRPAVQSTLSYVQNLVKDPVRNANQAYNVRKTIGDLMEGKIGGDQASSKVARRELIEARDLLDTKMSEAFPEWGTYLPNYRAASQQADQARVGQYILGKAGQVENAVTGERSLTPNLLARIANDPDSAVRAATGFNRGTAAGTLTQPQRGLLGALGDEASSMNALQAGRATGSDTAQNLASRNLLAGVLGPRFGNAVAGLRPVQAGLTTLEKAYGVLGAPKAIEATIVEMLANPQQAQAVMARLDAPTRQAVERWIAQSGATAGLLGSQQP